MLVLVSFERVWSHGMRFKLQFLLRKHVEYTEKEADNFEAGDASSQPNAI